MSFSPLIRRAVPLLVGIVLVAVSPPRAAAQDASRATVVIAPRPTLMMVSALERAGTPVTRNAAARVSPDSARVTPQGRTIGRPHAATVFYGLVAVGTLAAFELRLDPDEGGYQDGWQTKAPFPDKVVHALASFALTSVGADVGARPWLAATAVCAAGAAFEYSQGYVSYMDISANCLGATGAALWKSWTKSRDARAGR